METKRFSTSKEKRIRRKEVLEKKKAIDEIIKKASSVKDHLLSFPPFCQYERNGLSVYLESGIGDQLASPIKKYIQDLLKVNMEGPYGSEWQLEEKVKRREMVSPEARYIFVRQSTNAASDENPLAKNEERHYTGQTGDQNHLVGFVHYRFIVEEDIPVVYVYELQLEACAQRKGLGKFLMQLIELIAHKNRLGAVMLTVQKANVLAMNFYTTKLRYTISTISPSRVDPLIGAEKSYEILCKTFDSEAKAKLEVINHQRYEQQLDGSPSEAPPTWNSGFCGTLMKT
ncbi:Acetyltransferase (GNAT) family [Musa troglodytarum]|uniref:N-alpha-acetyltransferase 40 n=1 Tax=Musa troglodytarum TaxID=320322 RepID=A0A9E7KRX2_9LILI|nr:Acetyltransferase (GNAT) family [Musa troglodytarum]